MSEKTPPPASPVGREISPAIEPTHFTRRKFLHTASGIIGAASVAQLDVSRFAHAAGSDTLRVGLIGCGGRGTGAASDILRTGPGVRLIAMGDLFERRLIASLATLQQRAKDQTDVVRDRQFIGFDAYRKVLEAGVDAVILATPPGFRPMHFEAVVTAGKHCFMEPEVAVDAPGIRRLIKAAALAKTKSLSVIVGYQRRFHPGYEAIVAKVHEGTIGDITRLEVYRKSSKGFWLGKRADLEVKMGRKPTELEYQLNNWLYFTWLSGDNAADLNHKVDLSHWLMRGFPQSARATSLRKQATGTEYGDRSDFFSAEYTYGNGAKLIAETCILGGEADVDSEVALGTKGAASCKNFSIADRAGLTSWSRKLDPSENGLQYQREQDMFVQSIRKGQRLNMAEDAANVALTCLMGRAAAALGRDVSRQETLASKEAFFPDGLLTWEAAPPTLPDKFGDYQWPARGRNG